MQVTPLYSSVVCSKNFNGWENTFALDAWDFCRNANLQFSVSFETLLKIIIKIRHIKRARHWSAGWGWLVWYLVCRLGIDCLAV